MLHSSPYNGIVLSDTRETLVSLADQGAVCTTACLRSLLPSLGHKKWRDVGNLSAKDLKVQAGINCRAAVSKANSIYSTVCEPSKL